MSLPLPLYKQSHPVPGRSEAHAPVGQPDGTHEHEHAERPRASLTLRVGDLAKRTGKTVRALHLYEEHGLLAPAERSSMPRRFASRLNQRSVSAKFAVISLQNAEFSASLCRTAGCAVRVSRASPILNVRQRPVNSHRSHQRSQ